MTCVNERLFSFFSFSQKKTFFFRLEVEKEKNLLAEVTLFFLRRRHHQRFLTTNTENDSATETWPNDAVFLVSPFQVTRAR